MNDIDPLLHEAMANVKGPVDLHPSVSDVHRRALAGTIADEWLRLLVPLRAQA